MIRISIEKAKKQVRPRLAEGCYSGGNGDEEVPAVSVATRRRSTPIRTAENDTARSASACGRHLYSAAWGTGAAILLSPTVSLQANAAAEQEGQPPDSFAPRTIQPTPALFGEVTFMTNLRDVSLGLTTLLLLVVLGWLVVLRRRVREQTEVSLEALQAWNDNPGQIDLVFTDIRMPHGMSGLDLATNLRALKPDLKVLFTSGYTPEADGDLGPLDENVNFLPKPYPPPKLVQMVKRTLNPGVQAAAN